MRHQFNGIFEGLTVLVTGHTGFKGSWLSIWLRELGANVVGYSLEPSTQPSNFELTGLHNDMMHITGDIRDFSHFSKVLHQHEPHVIFHLAAQPLVLPSYECPKDTFDINAGGTVNVLEAARGCGSIKAMVMVTTDKCYENKDWIWGYRENDALGGKDPYSASKSMAELAILSYNQSIFNSPKGPFIASARAGNVIGGGDFSEMRIMPDCMSALMQGQSIKVRNQYSVRPWVSVLDPISGYLWLATFLLEHGRPYAEPWNFGPMEHEAISVRALVEKAIAFWGKGEWKDAGSPANKQEMGMLRLNWDKAANRLKWRPVYSWAEAVEETVEWYKMLADKIQNPDKVDMRAVCVEHIRQYSDKACRMGIPWAVASEEYVGSPQDEQGKK